MPNKYKLKYHFLPIRLTENRKFDNAFNEEM